MHDLKTDLIEKITQMYESGLVISPWLKGVDNNNRFDPLVFERLDSEAREYSAIYWTDSEMISNFNTLPIPESFPQMALYETFASTAVFIAHEQTGNLLVDEEIALQAISRVKDFCGKFGLGTLVFLYRMIATYENLNAVNYFGGIPERQFLLGSWHRPWVDYPLSDDLMISILLNVFRIVIRNNRRYVELTPNGFQTLLTLRRAFEESGHFSNRVKLFHISQFDLFEEYEKLVEEILPEAMSFRERLIGFAGIKPGMIVLELGCGSGPLTFEAGLADRIGAEGKLISVDPSAGMLNRAKAKSMDQRKYWVEFRAARAESLPFEDGYFDVTLGSAFLNFTQQEEALKEMRRVTRPGGVVASLHPLTHNLKDVPFFQEWFSPIFQLAMQRKEAPRNNLFSPETGVDAFKKAGLIQIENQHLPVPTLFHDPDKVIKHFIHGVGLFQEELADLPWKARQEIMERLYECGVRVCQSYPETERIIFWPFQLIKGIAPRIS